jgi:dihydrofolate reductase
MGRVFVHMSVTVDGFFEGPDADISWSVVDAEVHGFINDTLRGVPSYLLGRRTYELMQAYWPTADERPDADPIEIDFAQIWRGTQKVVASRTLDSVWPGDVLVRSIDADLVRSLAEKGDVGVGGPELAAQMFELGLVDEVLLNVHPVVIGAGRQLFAPGTRLDLRLLDSHVFANGVVHLRYAVGR